ncbi:MAG: hypothetical protein JW837_13670 [Sedimentisphaerales bacterium]|nr:hypothetical protein [Sedimentisphaerales bacterium]
MERPENDKWLDDVLSDTIGSKKSRMDFEQWKQNHPEAVEMLTSRGKSKIPTIQHPHKIRIKIMKSPISKLAAAAVIAIAVFIGIDLFDTNGSSVVWADVAEQFESVPFFNVTMYIGQDTSTETKKIEIWKSPDSRVRAHEGNTVFFADFSKDNNKFIIFDRSTKKLVNSGENVPMFIRLLCNEGRFSLDTLTKSFPPQVKGITPLETADTAASRETVLFEARHETTPERLMIWALRTSKLPVRMTFRDPRKNEYGDFIFDYSEKKDDKFFDPEVFKNEN